MASQDGSPVPPAPSSGWQDEVRALFTENSRSTLRLNEAPRLTAIVTDWLAPGAPVPAHLLRAVAVWALDHADRVNARIDSKADAFREAIRGFLLLPREVDDPARVYEEPQPDDRDLVRGKASYRIHLLRQRWAWAWLRYIRAIGHQSDMTPGSRYRIARMHRGILADRLVSDIDAFIGDEAAVRDRLDGLVSFELIRPELRTPPDGRMRLEEVVSEHAVSLTRDPEALTRVAFFVRHDPVVRRLIAAGINWGFGGMTADGVSSALEAEYATLGDIEDDRERRRTAAFNWVLDNLPQAQQAAFTPIATLAELDLDLETLTEGFGITVYALACLIDAGLVQERRLERYRLNRELRPQAARFVTAVVPQRMVNALVESFAGSYAVRLHDAVEAVAFDRLRDSRTLRARARVLIQEVHPSQVDAAQQYIADELPNAEKIVRRAEASRAVENLRLECRRVHAVLEIKEPATLARELGRLETKGNYIERHAKQLIHEADTFIESVIERQPELAREAGIRMRNDR